ncbi:hypothetical protein FLAG1_11753 [Fusarium langsethiae]|uniref:HNH nuclease domain-containing protein n=1 Tax=Fusarium langsethiae TaxID=179993 RepID=A0A0M9ELJ3_FUSLA|nr:hypothetical protein FLAG1_11753 [Fusarium langsethiae]GKU08748.1 unnamed protein product [Fusarium langsethiae]
MASSAVTASRRSAGWNVVFLAVKSHSPFAGVFSPADCSLLTFQDVVREMSLCFDFGNNRNTSLWENIAFETLDTDLCHESFPSFVQDLSLPVPSLDSPNLKRPNILRFRILHHSSCQLPNDAPLDTHLQAKCVQYLPQPVRRHNPRYLPPKTASSDPRYARMPHRSILKGRRVSTSPKRPRSGSVSPNKDPTAPEDIDVNDVVMPANTDVDLAMARKYASSFRTSCLDSANTCAVSGKGASWYFNSDVGPALHACHIVEQKQYHLYPVEDDDDDDDEEEQTMYSTHRLRELWIRTWSPGNSILMLSHLHELFDARLFSIHPKTHRIRAFVPYDVITEYHGRKAALPRDVDPLALQHHYDMCCIENMAAKFPYIEVTTSQDSTLTSGTRTPASTKTDLPATPRSEDPSFMGDPSKKQKLVTRDRDRPSGAQDAVDGVIWPREGQDSVGKRKRSDSFDLNVRYLRDAHFADGYITPLNSRGFLADVNWELKKFKARKQC